MRPKPREILLLVLTYHVVMTNCFSMETDDSASTYDGSERDSILLIPAATEATKQAGKEDQSSEDTDSVSQPMTGSRPGEATNRRQPSGQEDSFENDQVTFGSTPRPNSKSRSRKRPRRLEIRRTTRRLNGTASRSLNRDDLDIILNEEGLNDVILSLKDQLRESQTLQTITRSILNVVQEKQQALEEDLSFLKNEISALRRSQSKDHDTITALKDLVADNTWAVTSLVTSQEQLKKDVTSLKEQQEAQNASLWHLEEVVLVGVKRANSVDESLALLSDEIRQMKEWREADRQSVQQLQQLLGGQLPSGPPAAGAGGRRRPGVERSNHIEQKSAEVVDVDVVDFDVQRLASLASALDEKHNLVEQSLQDLSRKEAKLKQDMRQFSQKFNVYDTELSRVYTMFYNLSYQMSSLENKLLQQQQGRYETNLAELQQSLMNFTQHIYSLEQRTRMNDRMHANASSPYGQHGVDVIRAEVDGHRRRIELLEKIIHEHKLEQHQLHDLSDMKLSRINKSIARFYKSFQDHHMESADVFDFIDEKFEEFDRRIDSNDDRLLRVEVRVLNASLGQCERANLNLQHDKDIGELKESSLDLTKAVGEHSNLIDRIDRGMSRIFEDFGKHAKKVEDIANKVQEVTSLVPQVSVLRQEVEKLVRHLPRDCDDVLQHQAFPRSGPYLIKPKQSASSADAYCQFDGKVAWTVVQRRQDGSVSFSRDWTQYKRGFGSADGEFWIGNDNLHHLTAQQNYLVRIEMTDLQGQAWWAEYDAFRVDGEESKYKLHLGAYRGNATDALRYSADMPFSTIDRDNDHSSTHCARFYTAGWWYKHCHYGNLNGRYTVGVVWFNHDTDEWIQLKRAVMKIRRMARHPPAGASQNQKLDALHDDRSRPDGPSLT